MTEETQNMPTKYSVTNSAKPLDTFFLNSTHCLPNKMEPMTSSERKLVPAENIEHLKERLDTTPLNLDLLPKMLLCFKQVY